MKTKEVGFGVIGCGVIGAVHAESIQAAEGAALLAVYDIVPEAAAKLGERFGVPYYSDPAKFLAHPGMEAVTVCVPSGLHAEVGIQAAAAGKHVLVEKPIDITLQAADRLIEACDKAGVKLGVISQHRFAPDIIKVKQAIEAGEFGPLVLGEASIKWYRTQQYYDSGAWRGTWALDGGGALTNQGVHYIDLLQWLMGPVASVKAMVATRTHQVEVEDLGVAVLQFASGALGTITGSTSVFPGLAERLELHGRDATALIESDKLKTYLTRANLGEAGNYGMALKTSEDSGDSGAGGAANPAAIGNYLHIAQIADFASAVRENRAPAITGQDARRPLELIQAIYRSANEGREVKLGE